MKKLLSLICALCAFVALCAFAGCAEDDREPAAGEIEEGYSVCYAFTVSADKMTVSADSSVLDYMNALSGEGRLSFDGYTGDYGYYVTAVLGVRENYENTGNSYKGYAWALYTTVTTIDGVVYSSDYSTFNYNGLTLYSANYGVSGTPCVVGETYALVYSYSQFSW